MWLYKEEEKGNDSILSSGLESSKDPGIRPACHDFIADVRNTPVETVANNCSELSVRESNNIESFLCEVELLCNCHI